MHPNLAILLVLAVVFGSVHCDSSEGDGFLAKLKKIAKDFFNAFKVFWNDFMEEVKLRTVDMTDWTREMFNSFKGKMNEWVNEVSASDAEKEDMRNYIERLQMPTEETVEK